MKKNLLNEKLTATVIRELAEEVDEHLALRRALLHCVLLLEESKDPAVRSFVDHLLVDFHPLASAFSDEKHPYLAPFEVMRARLRDGRLTAFLPLARLKAWLDAS